MFTAAETKFEAEVGALRTKVNGLEKMGTELNIEVSELKGTVQHQESLLAELNCPQQTNRTEIGSKSAEIDFRPTAKVAIMRTCQETRASDQSLPSGMYWIDPDGQGVGDDAIYVYCDMTKGRRRCDR